MGKQSKSKKRPFEPQNVQFGTQSGINKRHKGPGHVQNALNQTLHGAKARSDGLLSSQLASSPQSSLATFPSCPPETLVGKIPHVPRMKQLRHSTPRPDYQKPAKLPQLPPIQDKSIEEAVFTHQWYLSGYSQDKLTRSYDRLEFLGDAYVEVIASRLVYSLYPHMPAGRLSQQRENLVKNESLAAHSLAYGFDKRARLQSDVSNTTTPGSRDQQNGSMKQKPKKLFNTVSPGTDVLLNDTKKHRPPGLPNAKSPVSKSRQNAMKKQETKIFGDIFEAYVAAVVLSNPTDGYRMAEEWLHKLWIPKLEAQSAAETREPPPPNSKNELAKWVMGKGTLLEYRDTAPPDQSESSAGKTWYTIGAFLTGWGWSQAKLGEGRALNKNQAGSMAAAQALEAPLTKQISRVKKEFDSAVAKERGLKEQQIKRDEQTWHGEEPFNATHMTSPQRYESEEEQNGVFSQPDGFDDSDDGDWP